MYPLTAGLVIGSKELGEQIRSSLERFSVRVLFELPEVPENWSEFLDRIERVGPDVILLEDTHTRWSLRDVVEKIRSTVARPAVFVLHQTADPDAILAALRAGVSEFLYPPFDGALQQALDRLAAQRQQDRNSGKRNGKILVFLSAKGGCGATTVASHISAELVRYAPGKVLMADLDLQSGIVGFLFKTKSRYSLADATSNVERLDRSYWKAIISEGIPGLDVITAPIAPSEKNIAPADAVQVLAFARTQYDWIVVDLGRGLTPFNLSILELADQTYLISGNDIPSLHEARQMIQTMERSGYAPANLHLILNRMPKRSEVSLEDMEKMLGAEIFAALPDGYADLQEAYEEGRLLNDSSALGKSLARTAASIAGVSAPKKGLFSFLS